MVKGKLESAGLDLVIEMDGDEGPPECKNGVCILPLQNPVQKLRGVTSIMSRIIQ